MFNKSLPDWSVLLLFNTCIIYFQYEQCIILYHWWTINIFESWILLICFPLLSMHILYGAIPSSLTLNYLSDLYLNFLTFSWTYSWPLWTKVGKIVQIIDKYRLSTKDQNEQGASHTSCMMDVCFVSVFPRKKLIPTRRVFLKHCPLGWLKFLNLIQESYSKLPRYSFWVISFNFIYNFYGGVVGAKEYLRRCRC